MFILQSLLASLLAVILASSDYVQIQPKILYSGFSVDSYRQGHSVAISNDGTTIAVSVPGFRTGDGFVYSWNEEQQVFYESGVLFGGGAVGVDIGVTDVTQVGYVVAINGNGSTIFLSRTEDNSYVGATWVFVGSPATLWNQQGSKLVGSYSPKMPREGSCLASSLDGNTLVVGGWTDDYYYGGAWIFVRDAENNWSQQSPQLSIYREFLAFGTSCALSANGDIAIISASSRDFTGTAVVFTRNSQGIWSLVEYIPNEDNLSLNQVSLSADGKTALIGTVTDTNVTARVLEYNTLSNSWETTAQLQTNDSSRGPYSVALSSDGNTAVIGTPGLNDFTGAAWVFTRDATSGLWSQNAQVLTGNDASPTSYQGFSVSISGNGDTIVFGGPNDSGGVGATWVFRKATSAPTSSPHTAAPVTNSHHHRPKHSKKNHKRLAPTSS